jgi:RNA-binding protein
VALTGKQRRALRAMGHHLVAVVQVGHAGITPGVLAALEQALWDHELVKVKVASEAPGDRKAVAAELAEATGAELAQVLGRTLLLYKPNPDEPRIEL